MSCPEGTVNFKPASEEGGGQAFETLVVNREVGEQQTRRLALLRKERDHGDWKAALAALTKAARGTDNLMPPILEALNVVKGAITNRVLQNAIQRVHDAIREGENIAGPLGQSRIFDDIVVNMIDVGEETGELDKMLLKIADTYDSEVDEEVGVVIGLLEPILIVLMGGAVFLIVLALFLPLLTIVDKIKVGG